MSFHSVTIDTYYAKPVMNRLGIKFKLLVSNKTERSIFLLVHTRIVDELNYDLKSNAFDLFEIYYKRLSVNSLVCDTTEPSSRITNRHLVYQFPTFIEIKPNQELILTLEHFEFHISHFYDTKPINQLEWQKAIKRWLRKVSIVYQYNYWMYAEEINKLYGYQPRDLIHQYNINYDDEPIYINRIVQ